MNEEVTLKNRPKEICIDNVMIPIDSEVENWFKKFEKKMRNLMIIYGDDPDLRQFIQQEVLGK